LSNHFHRTPLSDILITETVRLIEEKQTLDDSTVMRLAYEAKAGQQERLIQRAWLLGNDLGLPAEWQQWKRLIRYTGVLLLVFACLFGAGVAASVTGNRTLNAPYALLLALGPHFLALLLWLVTLFRPSMSDSGSIGSLLLRGLARLPFRHGPYFWTMLHAAASLFARNRLLPWITGIASHAFWAAALAAALLMLALSFSFQAYRLTWETTILPADFFIEFVRLSGWLPQQLGFPLPDTDTLLNPAAPDSDHRAWAWWLIGCISLYGLLPRVVLSILSWAVWRMRRRRLKLDLAHPYYAKLLARFNEMERSAIIDPEERPARTLAPLTRQAVPGEPFSLAVIGFELPDEMHWPPEPVGRNAELVERIAGSIQERRALLDKLAQLKPYGVLFICNTSATPDRGTAGFLREAAAHAVRCALWLPSSTESAEDYERWRAWLADMGLDAMPCLSRNSEVVAWMENKHG
jgi:hypothetical protein